MSTPDLRSADTTTLLASTVFPIALGVVAGLPGVAVGLVAIAVLAVFGRPFGFAIAQVGLLGVPFTEALLVELVFAAVLIADVARIHRLAAPDVARIVGAIAGLSTVVVAVAALADFDLLVSALVVIATVALVSYGLHRYAVVTVATRTEEQR